MCDSKNTTVCTVIEELRVERAKFGVIASGLLPTSNISNVGRSRYVGKLLC